MKECKSCGAPIDWRSDGTGVCSTCGQECGQPFDWATFLAEVEAENEAADSEDTPG
jgi:uncharacterized Zn finger protein (UPF0148 family)